MLLPSALAVGDITPSNLRTVAIMLLPSALAVGDITPSNLRTVGLLPFAYVFPALGLWAIKAQIPKPKAQSVICHLSLVILLLAFLTPITATAYFRDWAPSAALLPPPHAGLPGTGLRDDPLAHRWANRRFSRWPSWHGTTGRSAGSPLGEPSFFRQKGMRS